MMGRTSLALAACVLLAAAGAACGKKGNPLPPLRPVPARIADMTAVRTAGQVELRFTVPAANLDGSVPVVIDRVDIYALEAELPATRNGPAPGEQAEGEEGASEKDTVETDPAEPGGPSPPPAGQIASSQEHLIESLPVRRLAAGNGSEESAATSALVPAPGETATFVHRTAALEEAGGLAIYYVAVPVAGTGRGRAGPPTPVISVPTGPLPAAPANLSASHDETNLSVSWTPAAEGHSFRVLRQVQGDTRDWEVLTPAPLTAAVFASPVEFGRQTCLGVQALQITGSVVAEGATSNPVCLVPVDRYPPDAPESLQVVQEGTTVTVIWRAVESADLAGYVVLRGDGPDGALAPLFSGPVVSTTYRDTTVVAGMSYSYAVYAIDSSPAANVSPLSPRETLTVR